MNQSKQTPELTGENAALVKLFILVAWASGDLSEGQAVKALQVHRVEARQMLQNAAVNGVRMAEILSRAR